MPLRVAITAAAVRTALGSTPDEVWQAIQAGHSGIRPIVGFDASGFSVTEAAQIWREPDAPEDDPALRILGPHGRLLDAVCLEAHGAARLETLARERVGLFVGMGMVDSSVDDLAPAALASRDDAGQLSLERFFAGPYRQIHPLWPLSMLNNVAAGQIAIDLDIRGDNAVLAADADAGVRALLEGARSLQEGHADAVLAAGVAGRVTPALLARRALSGSEAEAPPGEGGAALVLEREDDARRRGAPILGLIRGGATAFGGEQAVTRAMQAAFEEAERPIEALRVQVDRDHLGDLGPGAAAVSVVTALAGWRRVPPSPADRPPRWTTVLAAGSAGGVGVLVIEEAV